MKTDFAIKFNLIQTVIQDELLYLHYNLFKYIAGLKNGNLCEMNFFWDRSAQNIFLKFLFRIEQQQKKCFLLFSPVVLI